MNFFLWSQTAPFTSWRTVSRWSQRADPAPGRGCLTSLWGVSVPFVTSQNGDVTKFQWRRTLHWNEEAKWGDRKSCGNWWTYSEAQSSQFRDFIRWKWKQKHLLTISVEKWLKLLSTFSKFILTQSQMKKKMKKQVFLCHSPAPWPFFCNQKYNSHYSF